jgi:hypothetical protein
MMRRLIVIIVIAWFTTACEPGLSSFDKDVNALIRKQCTFEEPCQISIGEATSYDWDEMYVFRPGITGSEAEKILPAAKGFEGEFNRKIAFLKDGKLARLDEAASIIEGEHTPPGMLFFITDIEGNHDCLRFSRAAVFEVIREKWIRGNVYRLACVNCTSSPVFAEFGTGSR